MNRRFRESDFLHSDLESVQPGTILVAPPALENTPFRRTVILILQNNDQGTFGVVLNRPANDSIRSAWTKISGEQAELGLEQVVNGGPIGGPVFAIHTDRTIAEHEVLHGVYVSTETENFMQLVEDDQEQYRIVFGLAGWKKGQLIDEISEGLWYVLDGDSEHVFDDPEQLWESSLLKYSRLMLMDVVGLTGLPEHPTDN